MQKKKTTQDDAIRLTKKAVEALDGKRQLTDATLTSVREKPVAFLMEIKAGQKRGGEKAAATKKKDKVPRNHKICATEKRLSAEGHEKSEIPKILAEQFGLSVRQIRRILSSYK